MDANRNMAATDWRALHGLLFVALFAATTAVPALRTWPGLWLAPLAVYAVLVFAVLPLRASFRRWRFGRTSTAAVLTTIVLAAGSCGILLLFQSWRQPDLTAFVHFLPVTSWAGGMLSFAVVFCTANALLEEIVFRGILFDAVDAQWGGWMAALVTALLFGFGHMRGYPPGLPGAVLAGLYGLCLGALRTYTGGIGLPFLAHIVADVTILKIVLGAVPH